MVHKIMKMNSEKLQELMRIEVRKETLILARKNSLYGDGTFSYNPNGQFEGISQGQSSIDSFTYTVGDGNGWTDTATVTIKINGLDDVPPSPTQKLLEIKGDPASAN